MDVQLDDQGPLAVAKLTGSITATDAESLTEKLADVAFGERARLAIDLSGLTAIDSSGLSALINLVTRSRLSQGRVILVAPSTFVSSIFSVTHLDQWFEICETMEDATKQLSQA